MMMGNDDIDLDNLSLVIVAKDDSGSGIHEPVFNLATSVIRAGIMALSVIYLVFYGFCNESSREVEFFTEFGASIRPKLTTIDLFIDGCFGADVILHLKEESHLTLLAYGNGKEDNPPCDGS
ncbi:hypothetical protein L1987_45867 [Smallanthus sonchifolius]|uniref:Uncharacterized protein n=1 Tax=Smallanthus sonchifolius TaxID=185202 RepID=A0ACB9FY99_9ASTR|nr:hypothetical protein L1987_45867 [Smallanthus sonchifolius]